MSTKQRVSYFYQGNILAVLNWAAAFYSTFVFYCRWCWFALLRAWAPDEASQTAHDASADIGIRLVPQNGSICKLYVDACLMLSSCCYYCICAFCLFRFIRNPNHAVLRKWCASTRRIISHSWRTLTLIIWSNSALKCRSLELVNLPTVQCLMVCTTFARHTLVAQLTVRWSLIMVWRI